MKLVEVSGDDKKRIERIVEIEEEAFGKNGGVDEWILTPIVRYGKVFILEVEKEIVSIAEYIQRYESKEMFLYGLCTEMKNRGKGYAKSILKLSEEEFRKKGMKKISLTVDPKNKIAIKLYEDLGYLIEKLQKNEYGQGIDRLLMYKEIK